MRQVVCVLAVLMLGATFAAGAGAAPAINGIYDVSDTPSKLTQGADGNVWVVVGGNTLARFSASGAKQEFPLAGVIGAKGITSGPDGNLWLTAPTKIIKVPPANPAGFTEFTVNDVIQPQAIVTGPDGNLWTGSADKVLKITTADPANPTLYTLTSTASPSARGITSSGGLLWAVDFGGAIVSLTTAGVQTPYAVGGGPQEVGAGPSGQVLYANPGNSPQQVGRILPGGLPQKTDRPMADPFGVAFGQDGAYWVAEFAAGDLARVTPDGAVTTLGGLPKNDPREIATGPSNTLWVSLELSKKVARVTGVDPPPAPPLPSRRRPRLRPRPHHGARGRHHETRDQRPADQPVALPASGRGAGEDRGDETRSEGVADAQRGRDGDLRRGATSHRAARRAQVRRAGTRQPAPRRLRAGDARRRVGGAAHGRRRERRRFLGAARAPAGGGALPPGGGGPRCRRQPLGGDARRVHAAPPGGATQRRLTARSKAARARGACRCDRIPDPASAAALA